MCLNLLFKTRNLHVSAETYFSRAHNLHFILFSVDTPNLLYFGLTYFLMFWRNSHFLKGARQSHSSCCVVCSACSSRRTRGSSTCRGGRARRDGLLPALVRYGHQRSGLAVQGDPLLMNCGVMRSKTGHDKSLSDIMTTKCGCSVNVRPHGWRPGDAMVSAAPSDVEPFVSDPLEKRRKCRETPYHRSSLAVRCWATQPVDRAYMRTVNNDIQKAAARSLARDVIAAPRSGAILQLELRLASLGPRVVQWVTTARDATVVRPEICEHAKRHLTLHPILYAAVFQEACAHHE